MKSIQMILFLIGMLCLVMQSFPQDNPTKAPDNDPKPSSQPSAKDKETASNLAEARRALQFGIDSTVLSVISQAISSKDKRLASEIEKQFGSLNPDVQKTAIEYFIALNDFSPHQRVEKMLQDYMDWQTPVVQSLLHFLQVEKKPAGAALVQNLIELTDASKPEIQAGAVDTIAACGSVQQLPVLLALFKKTGTATTVRSAIIKAFGIFKTDETFNLLKDVAEDKGEEKTLRYDALSALGQHGRLDSLATITKSLLSTDVFERGAAINALRGYELDKVLAQYQQALRDSFWRNRITVLKIIGEKKITALVEPVMYVAEQDPERPVQAEGYRTLATLDLAAGWKLMEDQLKNDKVSDEIRGNITEILVNQHFAASHEILKDVMQAEWSKEKSWLLNIICREVSNLKDGSAVDLYEKMLQHPNFEIQIYGVRGIKENNLSQLKPKLEGMLKNHPAASLKATIEEALR